MKTSDVVLIAGLMLCALFYEKDKILPFFVGSEATETDSTSSEETEDSQVFVPTDTVVYASKTITIHQELDSLPVDYSKRQAVVVTSQSVVLRGEKYKAEIVMLNPDSAATYETFVNGTKLQDGKYAFIATPVGKKKYEGYVLEKNTAGEVTGKYLFSGEYTVSEPAAYVIPLMSNVLYAGYPNPVKVVAPQHISSENITVVFTNASITKKGNNSYLVIPLVVGKECSLSVIAKVDGKPVVLSKQVFRTKPLPNPQGGLKIGLNSFMGGKIAKSVLMSSTDVIAEIQDPDFNAKFLVLQYDVFFCGTGEKLRATDGKITDSMKAKFKTLKVGDVIYFTHIRVKGADGRIRTISPIEITIK